VLEPGPAPESIRLPAGPAPMIDSMFRRAVPSTPAKTAGALAAASAQTLAAGLAGERRGRGQKVLLRLTLNSLAVQFAVAGEWKAMVPAHEAASHSVPIASAWLTWILSVRLPAAGVELHFV
jgi:hypothetical protein